MLFALFHRQSERLLSLDAYPAGECKFVADSTLSYAEPVQVAKISPHGPPLILKSEKAAQDLIDQRIITLPEQHCSLIALDSDVLAEDLEIVVMQNWVRRVGCTLPVATR
jgi:hypothetical protein